MGRAAYRLARQARWGDLWPSAYNLNPKRTVVPPPVAPGLYEEDDGDDGGGDGETGPSLGVWSSLLNSKNRSSSPAGRHRRRSRSRSRRM
jgi:hypothetical protein